MVIFLNYKTSIFNASLIEFLLKFHIKVKIWFLIQFYFVSLHKINRTNEFYFRYTSRKIT
ncbi:MAG: hypothetical protein CMH15_00935 [Mesonia sp.]|nr:hypothetical protein [Mesonia sp.]MAQ39616.1 hypothetical protein [Mesonia sp.]MBJ97872.1 hypothetical protein [Flavobacteriaceae bacterium]